MIKCDNCETEMFVPGYKGFCGAGCYDAYYPNYVAGKKASKEIVIHKYYPPGTQFYSSLVTLTNIRRG